MKKNIGITDKWIRVVMSSIADFSDHHSTLSFSAIHVETINETEFVYSFEIGGDIHEFRYIKKE